LGRFLTAYKPEMKPKVDLEEKEFEKLMENVVKELINADLHIKCVKCPTKDAYFLDLVGALPPLDGVDSLEIWPATVSSDHRLDILGGEKPGFWRMGPFSPASLTGLIVFAIVVEGEEMERLVLNLPTEGLPNDRKAALLEDIVKNRADFFGYLKLLLRESWSGWSCAGDDAGGRGAWDSSGSKGTWADSFSQEGFEPFLESLAVKLSRSPEQLRDVSVLIDRIAARKEQSVIPKDFLNMWALFKVVLEKKDA
jgi:hypothetical protein